MAGRDRTNEPPRIYADFNGLVGSPRNPDRIAVGLHSFGSLRDLCNAGVVLRSGLPLIVFDWSDEAEDLEGHGAAYYDARHSWWFVEFDEVGVRYVPAADRTSSDAFRCPSCRADLAAEVSGWVDVHRPCPRCGSRIDLPLSPP